MRVEQTDVKSLKFNQLTSKSKIENELEEKKPNKQSPSCLFYLLAVLGDFLLPVETNGASNHWGPQKPWFHLESLELMGDIRKSRIEQKIESPKEKDGDFNRKDMRKELMGIR